MKMKGRQVMIRRFPFLMFLCVVVLLLIGCGSTKEPAVESTVITIADIEGTWIGDKGDQGSAKLEISHEDDLYFNGSLAGYNKEGDFEGSTEILGRLMGSNQFVLFFAEGSEAFVLIMELRRDSTIAEIGYLVKDRYGLDYKHYPEGELIFVRR